MEELVSVSWDHTIKIWELELGGLKTELVANKVGIVDLKCEVLFFGRAKQLFYVILSALVYSAG